MKYQRLTSRGFNFKHNAPSRGLRQTGFHCSSNGQTYSPTPIYNMFTKSSWTKAMFYCVQYTMCYIVIPGQNSNETNVSLILRSHLHSPSSPFPLTQTSFFQESFFSGKVALAIATPLSHIKNSQKTDYQ
ncbi:hypothetical protein LOAG_11315 [Loa loa]|uniref:Uncharacterized protein n=1 Tax=Loa loa TaxID=7209 RepID=A0A1S0TN45_LOALO|nr:hypothetical protein LOAG_11315 [Loa loa]EFO17185.1 hypothetical protein LOAG_11315 [Loa loa]